MIQDDAEGCQVDVPLLAIWYTRPADGLPLLQDWLNTALDVFHAGYEGMREPMEVRMRGDREKGQLDFGTILVSKGLGRLSIILFGILFTYLKLKDQMNDEIRLDFIRPVRLLEQAICIAFGGQ